MLMKSEFIIKSNIRVGMKSKQSLFEQIIAVSSRKARQTLKGASLKQFEERTKLLPGKIKQLDVSPYLFIFEFLVDQKECVDFAFTQYQTMIEQNFLNPDSHSQLLVKQFRRYLDQHSFLIIQTMMKIKIPNLDFFEFFFQVQRSIAMPDNVLQNFKYTGYKWLSRCFSFKKCPRPSYIDEITSGIIQSEMRNLPTIEDSHKALEKYVGKIVENLVLQVQEIIEIQNNTIEKKFRYGYCLMCQKGADYYCKDTKISVCSSQCKKAHINYISSHPSIDFQYSRQTQQRFESLLMSNVKNKNNIALSTDYLCSIYTNSEYEPHEQIPHRQLLASPIIIQRVWLLYLTYYQRRGQIFQHIFADSLKCSNDYIKINAGKYFLKIASTSRIFEVYSNLDYNGFRRILPILINNLDPDTSLKFLTILINNIFNSTKLEKKIELDSSVSKSALLRKLNNEKNPLQTFTELTEQKSEEEGLREMMRFIIKNEEQLNKSKVCQLIIKDKKSSLVFFEELLLTTKPCNTSKNFKLIDEMLREIFYFVNIKVSDKIYGFLQILWEIINPALIPPHFPELANIFSSQNTEHGDTLFQFIYLILMIITELHNSDKSKKSTLDDFINRITHFDKKFSITQKQYISQVYKRIIEFPFSQATRGILVNYPIVKNQLNLDFKPSTIVLQNWEIIYESIMGLNNQTIFLYRICSILIRHPHICNSFMQLLLNKMDVNNLEEHLIPSINGILQEQPNCVGSSWSQVFYRHPVSQNFVFDLSALVHYSKSLNSQSFIWFAREFSKSVSLSENSEQCEKLLNYNFSSMNMFKFQHSSQEFLNFQERVNILNRQMVQLFNRQSNVYYQLLFLKKVFEIGDFDLGITLLDIVPINMVSGSLIICTLTEIVDEYWSKIAEYNCRKTSSKTKKSEDLDQKQVVNKVWSHILSKVLLIMESNLYSPESDQYFEHFSEKLRSIPECQIHFQNLNIERAIGISYLNRQEKEIYIYPQIHKGLRLRLNKFSQHIPQMDDSILEQFVAQQNLETIINHFEHFSHLDSVYALIISRILKSEKNEEFSGKIQKVLEIILERDNKNYVKGKMQAQDQKSEENSGSQFYKELPHYLSFTFLSFCFLEPSSQHHLDFNKELSVFLNDNLSNELEIYASFQSFSGDEQSLSCQFLQLSKILYHFCASLDNLLTLALSEKSAIFKNLSGILDIQQQKSWLMMFLMKACPSLVRINQNSSLRIKLWNTQTFGKISMPPGLHQHLLLIQKSILKINLLKAQTLSQKESQFIETYHQIRDLLHSGKSLWNQFLATFRSLSSKQKSKIKSQQINRESESSIIEFELKNQQIKYQQLLFGSLKQIFEKVSISMNSEEKMSVVLKENNKEMIELIDSGFDLYSPTRKQFVNSNQYDGRGIVCSLYLLLNDAKTKQGQNNNQKK